MMIERHVYPKTRPSPLRSARAARDSTSLSDTKLRHDGHTHTPRCEKKNKRTIIIL